MPSFPRSAPRLLPALISLAAVNAASSAWAVDERPVIAVVACDSYTDLRGQVAWIGEQVGNPTLAGLVEGFILFSTQGQGLAGLDVRRPLGVVVRAAGDEPDAMALVPVKDLDKLLAAVQGLTGPVQEADGVRSIAVPGGGVFEITERDGWAVVARKGSRAGDDEAAALIAPLVKDYSLGIQVFPARMPEGLRREFADGVRQGYAQATPGQKVDEEALAGAIEALEDVESLTLGFKADDAADKMVLEARGVMRPGSSAATLFVDAGKSTSTVGLPPAADGKPTAVQAHYAQAVPEAARTAVETALAAAVLFDSDDPATKAINGAIRDLVTAMLDAGGVDAALAVDTSVATPGQSLPALTVGMRIKDGAALERALRERLARPLPDVKVRLDAGKQGVATLHEIVLDISGRPEAKQLGDTITVTVAVAPGYAFVLTGDDVPRRIAAALDAGGKPIAAAQPIGGLGISLAGLVAYAAKLAAATDATEPQAEALEEVAREAAGKPSTRIAFDAQPIERGILLRLSADAGAIQTIAAGATAQQAAVPAPAGPVPGAGGRRPAAAPALAP
jgi:hypothetical protein